MTYAVPRLLEPEQVKFPLPPDGSERKALHQRFANRLTVRDDLSRRLVSYQGNKQQPGLRWMRYKEGFSADLVRSFLQQAEGAVLDPFAGIGTTVLIAASTGRPASGIEIMPVGIRVAQAISLTANLWEKAHVKKAGEALLRSLRQKAAPDRFRFSHVPITERAFPAETENDIARARAFLDRMDKDDPRRLMLDVACMSVLEETSYTRKDGQYLRWDNRCGRQLRGSMDKGRIPGFAEALAQRLREMEQDAPQLAQLYGGRSPQLQQGSALTELANLPSNSIGLVVTSPPYANRYDYTRTYALELAWLGYDKAGFGALRQSLITATVENRSKEEMLDREYPRPATLQQAKTAFHAQVALAEATEALHWQRSELGNPHVIRLVTNYFLEMSIVIAEMYRITRSGGKVVMVNDNVQYHGVEIPVDLILSDIAETCGFRCEEISVLPRGKGNASQQMGRFGRRELRKCVYHWTKP